jgi:hypothetical protein
MANSIGDDVICEATREAPAQAELRPTSAGPFRIIQACDAVMSCEAQAVLGLLGDVIDEAPDGTLPYTGASPYCALSGNTLDGQDNYVKGKRTFNSPQPSNEQLP